MKISRKTPFFDKQDIDWLSHFKACSLTDEEARTLIVIREMGAITNADYRTINAVDTLTASFHLRRLRDIGLLEQKGRGNATYYVPTTKLLSPDISPRAPDISPKAPDISLGAPDITPVTPQIRGLPSGFPPLPESLQYLLEKVGKRTATRTVKQIIKELCSQGALTLSELAVILERDAEYLRKFYLSQMVESNDLEYLYPENPTHPLQAYKAKVKK